MSCESFLMMFSLHCVNRCGSKHKPWRCNTSAPSLATFRPKNWRLCRLSLERCVPLRTSNTNSNSSKILASVLRPSDSLQLCLMMGAVDDANTYIVMSFSPCRCAFFSFCRVWCVLYFRLQDESQKQYR